MALYGGYQAPENLNTPTLKQAEATRIKREFEQAVLAVRADHLISTEGKRVQIARLYLAAAPRVAALQKAEQNDYDAAIARTEARLFREEQGTTAADAISLRDAYDRAEQLFRDQDGVDKAVQLLERAEATGDTALVRALVASAVRFGWQRVLEAYAGKNSDLRPVIEDYLGLRKVDPAASQLAYYTWRPFTPPEIAGLDTNAMEQLIRNG